MSQASLASAELSTRNHGAFPGLAEMKFQQNVLCPYNLWFYGQDHMDMSYLFFFLVKHTGKLSLIILFPISASFWKSVGIFIRVTVSFFERLTEGLRN